MNLSEFTKIEIDKFMGLYKRGMADQCPQDHAICCQNVEFDKSGQFQTRAGTKVSLALNHVVKKQYLATWANPALSLSLLTLDDAGNIYEGSNPTPIYTLSGMYDFHVLNIFNKVYILPITDGSTSPVLQVWDGTNPVRAAAGFAPTSTFTAADGAAAPTTGLDPGIHKLAICYITNTGFTTPPGPKIAGVFTPVSYTAPGGVKLDLSGLPLGGASIIGRVILATKANEEEYFFVPGGEIDDNTTTTLTLDFFDTDLTISADYLFDLLEEIPTQDPTGTGAGALTTYHARQVLVAGRIIRLSRPQEPEAFDNVNGYINVPANSASNVAISAFVLRDVLYMTLLIGVMATQDNLDDPGTWKVIMIDGAMTAYKDAIATIASNVPALGVSEVTLLGHREGIFIFDGTVRRPEITWKIKDVWDMITHGSERNINIVTDFYKKMIYVIIPTNNSKVPNLMLMGDYSEGLNWQEIKWTFHFFKDLIPYSIGMAYFPDDDGLNDLDYYLRIGMQGDNTLYKLKAGLTDDDGEAIDSRYCCYLSTIEKGAVNIFRALRLRVRGAGTLELRLNSEDFPLSLSQTPANITVPLNPAQDEMRQINFTNEKMSVQLRTNAVGERMEVDRVDIFAKRMFWARPQ